MHSPPPDLGRIALVRHGKSAHEHSGWIDAGGFRAWRRAYEAAGIRDDERPPESLVRLARDAAIVVSSDAPRAIDSARMLASEREVVVSPLLAELALEGPELGPLRLPLAAWAVAVGSRALWSKLSRRHPSADEAARVDQAAQWLVALAGEHAPIVAVTHASLRARIAERLVLAGWGPELGRRTSRHWSVWSFVHASGAR